MNKYIDEKWIKTDEAAEHLGVKPATIRGWIKKDTSIPAHKMGKFWKLKNPNLMLGLIAEKVQ